MIQGALTAVSRKGKISAPLRSLLEWLPGAFKSEKRILDYGCGRGDDAKHLGCEKWDPHWFPNSPPNGKYDTILCTYVFCVIPPSVQSDIIKQIDSLLNKDGVAFISVRDDIKDKQPGRGCEQRRVELTGIGISEQFVSKGNFRIYMMRQGYSHNIKAVGPCDTHGLRSMMKWPRT